MGDQKPDPQVNQRVMFHNLMDNITDIIYFKDTESRFVVINRAAARWFGLDDPEDAVGKTDFDFFTGEHAQQAFMDERDIIENRRPMVAKEEKETWPDKRETWVSSTKMPLLDDDGNVIGVFGISRDITERRSAEAALRRSENALRQRNEAMRIELERARAIQHAMLPVAPPRSDALEIALRYQPLEAVGGDYFSFRPLPGDGLGFFIGDVAGHGISAALYMALIKFIVDRLADQHSDDPKTYLEAINRDLMDRMPSAFITGIYGIFRPNGDGVQLCVADAGHPRPVLQRGGEFQLLEQLGSGALGVSDTFDTSALCIDLARGDRVLFYTDGLSETMNNDHKLLEEIGMDKVFQQSARPTLSETLDAVVEYVDTFRGPASAEDDIVLIGFEAK